MSHSIYIRYLFVFAFVVIYISLGFLLRLDPSLYLLLGIPLTIVFQIFICKQPLHNLWLKNEEKFKLNNKAIILAILFSVFPIIQIVYSIIKDQASFAYITSQAFCIIGAIGAGYCFSNFTKKTVKEFILCLVIAGALGSALMLLSAITKSVAENVPMHFNFRTAIFSLLQYIPISFVIEEVVFRGLLDNYLHKQGDKRGFLTAFFISALWGLWHLPIITNFSFTLLSVIGTSIYVIIVHSLTGIPFSIFYRRGGRNLAIPAFSHAFIDAIRNGLLK